jgi:hypothetical protein
MARQMSQAMIQNGMPASAVVEMLDSKSFSQIKSNLKKAEAAQQQLEEAAREAEQAQAQAAMEQQAAEVENENMNKEKDRQNKIEVAKISAGVNQQKNENDAVFKDRELDIKEKEAGVKNSQAFEASRANQAKESIEKSKISEGSKNEAKKLAAVRQKENNNKSK